MCLAVSTKLVSSLAMSCDFLPSECLCGTRMCVLVPHLWSNVVTVNDNRCQILCTLLEHKKSQNQHIMGLRQSDCKFSVITPQHCKYKKHKQLMKLEAIMQSEC